MLLESSSMESNSSNSCSSHCSSACSARAIASPRGSTSPNMMHLLMVSLHYNSQMVILQSNFRSTQSPEPVATINSLVSWRKPRSNDITALDALLHEESCNVDVKESSFSRTSLHEAAWHGKSDCLNALLVAGADMIIP